MSALPRYVPCSTTLVTARWQRSTHSTGANNCVETAVVAPGVLAVRDSKDTDGPALLIGAAGWTAFVSAVKEGAF